MSCILSVLIFGLLFCDISAQVPTNDCQLRGFSGATLNKCGYCVEGTTGLSADFGVDCAGTCGLAFTDCAGKCNGNSYWDECSGECINGNVLTVIPTAETTVASDVSFQKHPRDCRQLCSLRPANNVSSLNYSADSCGVCIIQTKEETVTQVTQPTTTPKPKTVTTKPGNVTSKPKNVTAQEKTLSQGHDNDTKIELRTALSALKENTKSSRYLDCTGTCYAPATFSQMANTSNQSCNQCVGPHTATKKESLVNPCGRCIPDPVTCLCPKAEQDMCGVCSGKNDTCTMIKSAFPSTIPSDILTKVNVVGVTLKSKYHSVCLLIREDVQADGRDEEKFPADIFGTDITCYIKAPEGVYRLHVGITLLNGEKIDYSNTSVPFIVYPNTATIETMSPAAVTIPKVNASEVQVTFATRNTQKIDEIFCTIYGGEYENPIVVTSKDVSANKVSCHLPYPLHSTTAYVNVSFDGNKTVAGPFSITFYASPPNITYFLPLPEGDSVVVFFDRDIAIGNLTNCSSIFTEESLSTSLGKNSTCTWVTKQQLMVTLDTRSNIKTKATPSSSVVDENVTTTETVFNVETFSSNNDAVILNFKDKTLYLDGETYADPANRLSVAFSLANELPVAVLVGPNLVPPCGDFLLDGHQSTGLQSRRARYFWKVTADAPSNVTGGSAISKNLRGLVDKATATNSASIIVESSDLVYRVVYTFTMTVSNGDIGTGAASSTASLAVIQSKLDVPAVMIEPSIASYNTTVDVHRQFTLRAHLDVPTCLRELYSIHFRWTTSNPRVKFDSKQMNFSSYTVEPYSLHPNDNTTFSVEVWLNNDQNLSSRASVTFRTAPSSVRAIVSGGSERTIATAIGGVPFTLNASQSYHVGTPYVPLVYRWECLEEDMNPCYNYDPNNKDTLLVERPITRDSVLSIPISRFRAGSRLQFNVNAFSPLNVSEMSDTQTVKVFVINGTAPMVTIDSVVPEDNSKNVPEVFDLVHQIPSESNVKVVASIYSTHPIASVKWNITGFTKDLAPYSLSKNINESQTEVTLIIRKDYIVPNGLYEVNLTVTNERGELGWAMAIFTVMRPITNCRVIVPDYEPFKMTYVYVDSCSTSHQNYPLSYQVFIDYKGCPMSLNAPEYHLPMAIMGPPLLATNSADNNYNVFSVKVCTVLDSCWWFNSTGVNVLSTPDMQQAAEHAFAMANIGKLTNDYLACLRRHSFYLMAATPSYREENVMEFESQLAQAFLCARRAAEVQCHDAECFANLFSFLTAFPIDSKTAREFMMTEVMDRAMAHIEERNLTLNAIGVQEAFIVLETVYRYNVSDVNMAKMVATLEERFQRILARSLHMGESPLLTDAQKHPVVAMQYNSLNTTLKVVTNSTGNSTVTLDFSNEWKQTYDTWTCNPDGSLCRGVVVQLQFYPESGYRPVDVDDKNTVSEVIKVSLLNPSTGDFVETKSDKGQALSLMVPVDRERMDKSLTYDCYFWNVDDQKWSTKGLETVDNGAQEMRCDSDRLATFAIIGSEPKLSTGVIIAIVVSIVIVLALLAGGAFFLYRKSRTKTMRVSISKGYHPNGQ